MTRADTDLDTDYIREEVVRIVNTHARTDEIESSDVNWLARTIADLLGEVERLLSISGPV